MRWHTLSPLVAKDLALFFRNRFFAFITILGLAAYVGLYLAMPQTVDEIIEVGLHARSDAEPVTEILNAQGLSFLSMDSEQELRQAVLDGVVMGGILLPEGMLADLAQGARPTVAVLVPSDTPAEMREVMVVLVEALALGLSGSPLNLVVHEETLGPDMGGSQIPPRDRMLPLLAVVVLMMETLGLASLIAEEIQTGTLRALMITPLGVGELFAAKGFTSVTMTFAQVSLLMLIIGGLQHQPLLILLTLLLGSLMVTGIGFLMASWGKEMLSVMGIGMLVIIVLSIPPFGVLFPGTVTAWARLIPSHHLADTIHQVANLGAGWGQVWQNLVILLAVDVLLFGLGIAVLKRKLR
jgi:hypothetical protein